VKSHAKAPTNVWSWWYYNEPK